MAEASENHIKLRTAQPILCEGGQVPPSLSLSSVEDSNRVKLNGPPQSKTHEDKASRKRFRTSFVLKDKKLKQKKPDVPL